MTKNESLTTIGLGNNSISYAVIHPPATTIVFISDLHFDYTGRKYKPNDADKRQEEFIDYVKEHYTNCILCLAGDFFDSHEKTLSFLKKLEENRIVGFCVLGNHDYWNDGTKSHDDIIRLFDYETQNNNYFRLLITGITSVRKHGKNYINFGNVDIYLPSVNECSLSLEEVMIQLKQRLCYLE